MRIIHTSDWHLGQYFYGKSRESEHQQFLHWLLAQATNYNVDAIIVAGDIFDTTTPPSYARKMYFNFISDLQAIDCQLIILAGNHDSVSMLAESKTLLGALSTHVVAKVTDKTEEKNLAEQVFTLKNKQGESQAVVCAIPYIRPRDVIKSQIGQSPLEKSEQLQQAIVEHYQHLYQQAKILASQPNEDENLPIIATGHLTAVGVTTTDSVRDIYIGTLEALPSSVFPAANYIALGHIHRAQKVGKTDHIRYSGSPIALSFDEATQTKKILLVDFDKDCLEKVTELDVPCFQPLAMIKSSVESLIGKVEKLVNNEEIHSSLAKNNMKLWLDIELSDTGLLQDLQPKIISLVKDFPVEVLLVRRQKQARKHMLSQHRQDKSTLNELTLTEVFESRLNQEAWLQPENKEIPVSEESMQRKDNLALLFNTTLEQMNEEEKA